MHTETYETVSDFKSIETAYTSGSSPARTLSPALMKPREEVVIFSKPAADKARDRVNRISRMKERMEPKDDMLFAPSIDGRLKIHTPFRVRIATSNGGVSAHAAEIEEFGHGTNRGEALDDLGRTIAELYFSLASERERLSSDLAGVLNSLEGHITRVHK